MDVRRKKFIRFRVNENERLALEVLASREGLPLSDLARTLMREALEARGIKTLGLMDLLYGEGVKYGKPR